MTKKILAIMFLIFSGLTINGGDGGKIVENEALFGIPVTSWVFEGSDGTNEYKFEWGYPLPEQSIMADYGYYFSFYYPNNVAYTFSTPVAYQNKIMLSANVSRKGTFTVEGNILTIHFTETQNRLPNSIYKSGEWTAENLTITMEVETDGRTELYLQQISENNIFVENDKNRRIKFVASILALAQ